MKRFLICCIALIQVNSMVNAANNIPANHPYIQYYGRWDFSDSLAPSHSWPGVYLFAKFEGTSIGVRMNDNYCYYNIFIDGKLLSVFKGNSAGIASYTLASGLPDSTHTLLFTKRNETTSSKFSFNGLILDDGKNLLPPPAKPVRKIEFMGDSYTSASGNEWTDNTKPLDKETQYTNIYEGFGPITARNYNAQYQMTSQAGYGLVLDWESNYVNNIPDKFDRTLCYTSLPKWDYEQWIPNLVVICLGLNDYSGFGGYSGPVAQDKTDLFKSRYHDFVGTIRDVYPGTKILIVAANSVGWIQTAVSEVVAEENNLGKSDVFYTYFPKYEDSSYVFGGHPTVATHHLIAERLIAKIDSIDAWQPYQDLLPPRITKLPVSPFIVYDTSYVLSIKTDSYATMRYSAEDKPYDQMEHTFTTTGKRDHSVALSCQHGIPYTYFLRGIDVYGNAMDSSAIVQFNVDTTKVLLNWTASGYDHSGWKTGLAPLSNISADSPKTLISSVVTAYFRKNITITDISKITGIGIFIKAHDGAVVYANGAEVARINMFADEEISYNSMAIGALEFNNMVAINTPSNLSKFHNSENTIAVEIHTANSTSPSVSFDCYMLDNLGYYFKLGSEWYYYNNGDTPPNQLADKVTDVLSGQQSSHTKSFVLYSNYPNPFNPSTTLKFDIPSKSHVTMNIFDLLGRKVSTLVDEVKSEGTYDIHFDGNTLSSGLYFCRLQAGNRVVTQKLVLLK